MSTIESNSQNESTKLQNHHQLTKLSSSSMTETVATSNNYHHHNNNNEEYKNNGETSYNNNNNNNNTMNESDTSSLLVNIKTETIEKKTTTIKTENHNEKRKDDEVRKFRPPPNPKIQVSTSISAPSVSTGGFSSNKLKSEQREKNGIHQNVNRKEETPPASNRLSPNITPQRSRSSSSSKLPISPLSTSSFTSISKIKANPREKFGYIRKSIDDYIKEDMLGEGTYGVVFRARCKKTNEIVAIKKIKMDREKEGFPITAIREITILKSIKHENIVHLKEVFVSIDGPHYYMVFEYVEHDLYGLLKARVPFSEDQARSLMRQLLNALKVLHGSKIFHRDLKTSNLLITQKGVLKLADFGLSRFQQDKSKYTNCVITRWYRPPELLLGATEYTSKIDMWSVGCILGEFMLGGEILPGQTEFDQLDLIWKTCGSPTQESWSNASSLPQWQQGKPDRNYPRRVRESFSQSNFSPEAIDLLDKLLVLDPEKRLSAEECLAHPWFQKGIGMEIPMNLPSRRCDELEFKKRRERGAHLPPPLSHNPHISYRESLRPDSADMPPAKKYKTSHPSSGPRGPPFKGSTFDATYAGGLRPGNGPPVIDSNLPLSAAAKHYGGAGVPPYHPHVPPSGRGPPYHGRGPPHHGRDYGSTSRMGRGPPGPDGISSSNAPVQHYQRHDQRVDADGGRSGYHKGGDRLYRHGPGRGGGGSAAGGGADKKYPGDGTHSQRPYYSSHHRPDGRHSHGPPFQHQSDHSSSGSNNNSYHSKPAPSSSQQHHSSRHSPSGQPERKRRDSNGHTTSSNGTGQAGKD